MEPSVFLIVALFASFIVVLLLGVPVAYALGGVAVLFTAIAMFCDQFLGTSTGLDFNVFSLVIHRIYQLMENWLLVALPMFIFMGHMLDRSRVADRLLRAMQDLLGGVRGGMALSVIFIGVLLAASTGIIGASVVLLGIMALPVMLRQGYSRELAVGTVCGAGTLGILMPPSIMLIIMANQLQLPVGSLFMGAVLPCLLLATLYAIYILIYAKFNPQAAPLPEIRPTLNREALRELALAVIPTLLLIVIVLGSIFFGIATPTEASGLGAFGAIVLAALHRRLQLEVMREVLAETMKTMGFIFAIFIGATCFSLVLRLLGGDELIAGLLTGLDLPAELLVALILLVIFFLGFFLDWIEITLIVLPLVAPVVAVLELDAVNATGLEEAGLVWFSILCAVTLQTSFLTPPVGFALFYVKGVCPPDVTLGHIYRGAVPFIALQLLGLIIIILFPVLTTWLPSIAF